MTDLALVCDSDLYRMLEVAQREVKQLSAELLSRARKRADAEMLEKKRLRSVTQTWREWEAWAWYQQIRNVHLTAQFLGTYAGFVSLAVMRCNVKLRERSSSNATGGV